MRLFKNWLSIYQGNLDVTLRNGLEMYLPFKHDIPILWEVFGDECYNSLRQAINPRVIVDLGANIGSFTLYASRVWPQAVVYAYEPSSANFDLLKINIYRNGVDAWPVAMAVGDTTGVATLHLSSQGDSGHASLNFYEGEHSQTELVPCITLDHVIDKVGGIIDFLKVDIEGTEYEMLKACTQLDKVKMMVVEGKAAPLIELLTERGFDAYEEGEGFVVGVRK